MYLNLLVLLQQNTLDWVIYKQQKFIAHTSRGWKFLRSRHQQISVSLEGWFLINSAFLFSSDGRGSKCWLFY
jgi:hypothetical protein